MVSICVVSFSREKKDRSKDSYSRSGEKKGSAERLEDGNSWERSEDDNSWD
jgi:hypothetical protein